MRNKLLVSLFLLILVSHSNCDNRSLLIVVLTDSKVSYHVNKYQKFKSFINDQLTRSGENELKIKTVSLYEQWPYFSGAWTVLAILKDLENRFSADFEFFLFCHEDSRIDLRSLSENVLNAIDSEQLVFTGHGLFDTQPTITHHFAFHENTKEFLYPDFAACVLLSRNLLKILNTQVYSLDTDFTIDVKYELAKYIYRDGVGIRLTPSPHFCNDHKSGDDACSTWYEWSAPSCDHYASSENVLFGVKTFSGNHKDRLPVIKNTWFQDTSKDNVLFFSNTSDPEIPTINAGPNTDSGHCSKVFFMFDYFLKHASKKYEVLVVCDDDTLLNIHRLYDMISCYLPGHTKPFIIGERYGYSVNKDSDYGGYSYPTGGAGMVFSRRAVELIASRCDCPTPDTPDDMFIGACIKHLEIDFIHSDLLHQARPYDYAKSYLRHQHPISFHKFWDCDPMVVYNNWLKDDAAPTTYSKQKHSEL